MFSPYKALITGGAGFIGSHLAETMLREGHAISIVDNLDPFYAPSLKRANLIEIGKTAKFTMYEVDIRDRAALDAVFKREHPDVVVHLAAKAGVRPSIQQPEQYEQTNVAGTLNLLDMARRYGVGKFVFGSSSSIYGATTHAPFTEDQVEMKPVSPYAATKLAGELLCYTYSHLYHLPVVSLRFFTVYGPRQRPDLAICKFAGLINTGRVIPVFGDGRSSRDYTYVDDIVRGILAATALETDYDVFNLGNSHPISLLDLIQLLEKTVGKSANVNCFPPQAGDVPLTWADISKARRLLNYEPRTQLDEGLRRFWEWYQESNGRRATAIHAECGSDALLVGRR
ncbi:MAG: GDP-mannose 4,6-dehydratase [Acidobacteriia bacterium]|nr:GDP-mannose 4,6-dehydratase [Terriglobia bacterium]